jgi:hypothetical protein
VGGIKYELDGDDESLAVEPTEKALQRVPLSRFVGLLGNQ